MGARLLLVAAKQAAEFIPPSMLGVIFGWTGNHIALPAFRQGGGTVTVHYGPSNTAPTSCCKFAFMFLFLSHEITLGLKFLKILCGSIEHIFC